MAHAAHLEVLTKDPEKWNEFRSEMNIEVPDLSNASLQELDLSRCDLSRAIFSRTTMHDVNLGKANCYKAIFDYGILKKVKLDQTNFQEASFQFARLGECKTDRPSFFSGAIFRKAHISNCDFSYSRFFRSIIEDCFLDRVLLNVCDCRYASFNNSSIIKSSLILTNCIACDFEIKNIEQTDLSRINLVGASTRADLDLRSHGFDGVTILKKAEEPKQRSLPFE